MSSKIIGSRKRKCEEVTGGPKGKRSKTSILSSYSCSTSLPDSNENNSSMTSETKRRPSSEFDFDVSGSGDKESIGDDDFSDDDFFSSINKSKSSPVSQTPVSVRKPLVAKVENSNKKTRKSFSAKKTTKTKSGICESKIYPQNHLTGRHNSNVQHSTTTKTFLSSLTTDTPIENCHPEARKFIKNFDKTKVDLVTHLFHLYNKEVFDDALPEDIKIDWNKLRTKTAGFCYSIRKKNRFGIETRTARLELSTKVIDRSERLRDTLIHEMCHAASWIISGYRDGHGPLWRSWGEKASKRFPELPLIGRCHSYVVETKYSYCCTKCGYTIGRHSKSLNTEKKVCGKCYSSFQLMVNSKPAGGSSTKIKDGGSSTPNPFALFVEEN